MDDRSRKIVSTLGDILAHINDGYSLEHAVLIPPKIEWKLDGLYKCTQPYRERMPGMGGVHMCVYIDEVDPKKAVLRNRTGIHLIGIHMVEDGHFYEYNNAFPAN